MLLECMFLCVLKRFHINMGSLKNVLGVYTLYRDEKKKKLKMWSVAFPAKLDFYSLFVYTCSSLSEINSLK